MSGTYTRIEEADMRSFLETQGFTEVKLDGTVEIVYSRVIARRTCLRVYTSVAYGQGRDLGTDAIRVCSVYKRPSDDKIVGIGRETRVNRIQTWKKNLQLRLDKYEQLTTPRCQKCGEPTQERTGRFGKFYGCSAYPVCDGVTRNP